MSIATIWQVLGVVFLVAWFGFLGWLVWAGWRELNEGSEPGDPKRPEPWSGAEKWLVGLGSAFIALIALDRITGSSDTAFLNSVGSLIGLLAVLAWMFTGLAAVVIVVRRLTLYVRRRRAKRRI